MMREVRQSEGVTVEMRCGVCGKRWRRTFRGTAEAAEYVRGHDVCPVGYHVEEGGIGNVVEVVKVR